MVLVPHVLCAKSYSEEPGPGTHGLRRDPQSAVVRDSQDHSAEQLWAEHNGKEREPLAGRPGWAPSPSCPLGQEGSQSPAEEPHGARYF